MSDFARVGGVFNNSRLRTISLPTATANIQIDFQNTIEALFSPTAVINGARTWLAPINSTNSLIFYCTFTLSGVFAQTFPANFIMADAKYIGAPVWQPDEAGTYLMKGVYDKVSAKWLVDIKGLYTFGA